MTRGMLMLELQAINCVCGEAAFPVEPGESWIKRGWLYAVGCSSQACPRTACGATPQEAVRRWNSWQRGEPTMTPNVEFSGTPAALSPEAPLERRVGHGGSDGE